MGTSTFTGIVRSENGFSDITKDSVGNVTTNSTFSNNTSIGGTLAVTGALTAKANVVTITDATYTVTAAQSGTTFIFSRAAGIVVTLPELTAAASGEQYTFIVGTTFTGAGQINTGATADLYNGFAIMSDPGTAGDTNTFIPDQSNDDTIDLGAIEQGWLSGGMITLTAQSATRWHCAAYLLGDATLATPFE
jgi:hypothetical protein|tara:strand:- start:243 stop:818 length:576 start_codon:yes stop_codon:yes gene_type:complete